jgi:hypothetical protein
MASKTLLDIIKQVSGELALNVPTAILTSSGDRTVDQMKALVVAACDELADLHDWQRLTKTHVITTVAGQAAYNMPEDCLRVINNTQFDRTNSRSLSGNSTNQSWAVQGNTTPGAATSFRIVGDKLVLFPVPSSAASTIAFDYITRNYVWDVGLSQLKPEFTTDSDKTVYHDRLLVNLVKLKFLQEEGMNTQAATENYNTALASAMGSDTPAPTINLAGPSRDWLVGANNLASTGWGQ